MSDDLDSVAAQASALANQTVTPTALAERVLDRAEQARDLNAFVAMDSTAVLSQAEAASERISNGRALSPIDGVPIAVKDNYLTKDYPTTACSNALPKEDPSIDATVVANLRAAGAVIVGKTNMHEWAYGATNSTSTIGPTLNPRDKTRITGGSSGGSAAAVAAGIVGAALGSDTGGSVRIPAAACGIYGFKPGYGRASRTGVLALSWSLDAPGPLTCGVDDIELLLPYFLGADPTDASTFGAAPLRSIGNIEEPTIRVLSGPGLECDDAIDRIFRTALSTCSPTMPTAEIDQLSSYFAAWEAILHCEASAYHKHRLDDAPHRFTEVTRAHLEAGRQITAEHYLHALSIRTHFTELLLNHLGPWDALALPTLPVFAPRLGEDWQAFGGRRVTTQDSMTWFCWLGNLAGLPSITIPIPGESSSLPAGMMLMGRPGRDEELLAIAQLIDRRLNSASGPST